MKRPGPYVPLSAHYADDEAIMQAGEDAELLYVRMLAYAARTPKLEGWISDRVLTTRLGIEERDAYDETGKRTGKVTGSGPGKRAEKLSEVGLVSRDGNGWRIVSWLKWNQSADQIEKTRAQDRSRKNALTSANTGNGTGKRTGNVTGIHPPIRGADTDTDTDTDNREGALTRSRATRLPESWIPSESTRAKMQAECPNINLQVEHRKFVDHWLSQPGKSALKTDWERTFCNWIRKAADFQASNRNRFQQPDAPGPHARRLDTKPDWMTER